MHRSTTVTVLTMLGVLAMCGPAAAQQPVSPTVPTLEVTAEATISAQPNEAQIDSSEC